MKTVPNHSAPAAPRAPSWPPAPAGIWQPLDPNHWQSRAARGFTWNRDGASTRRRPH